MKKILSVFIVIVCLAGSAAFGRSSDNTLSSLQEFNLGHELLNLASTQESLSHLDLCLNDPCFTLKDYALYLQAQAFSRIKDYKNAINSLNQIVTNYPQSVLLASAYYEMGKNYNLAGSRDVALATLNNLAKNFPDSDLTPKARLLSAQIMEKDHDFKNAYITYQNIDLFHPFSPEAKAARQKIKALKLAHKKGLPVFKPSAQALYDKAMLLWNNEDIDTAVIYFSKLIKDYPKNKLSGKALIMLGRAEIEQQKIDTAITNLEKASLYQGEAGTASFYMAVALARQDKLDRAISYLYAIQQKYPASEISDKAAYYLGYYLELDDKYNDALIAYWDLLNKYPGSPWTDDAIWRIGRIYYWSGDFNNAYTFLKLANKFPRGDMTAQAIFFQAKAAERLNKPEEALSLYQKVAQEYDFTYYSYRAREKLKLSGIYVPEKISLKNQDYKEAISQIKNNDAEKLSALMEIWEEANASGLKQSDTAKAHLEKCKSLLGMNMYDFAAMEAEAAIDSDNSEETKGLKTNLAQLFQQAGNYRAGINLVEKKVKKAVLAGKGDQLSRNIWNLAYPKGYYSQVKLRADNTRLDPYLVLAVIREESRFNPMALSRSRAYGLMQIIPSTGRLIAKDLDIYPFRNRKMYDPATNIRMGTFYLSNMIKRFDGNVYLALASYNGGPNRIKRYIKSWYNDDMRQVDIDEFVESIPIRETRYYVQKVMESYFQYRRIYGQS